MAESRLRRAAAPALAAVAAVFTMLTLGVLPVQTHSTHVGNIELYRGTSGPYEVLVAAVPLVGFLEVTVVFAVDTPSGPLPFSPRVVVLASHKGERLGPVTAAGPSSALANEYTAVLEPGEPGEWEITINIDGEPGRTTLTLPVTVTEDRSGAFPWPALAAGLGIVLSILWLAFAPRRKSTRSTEGHVRARATGRVPQFRGQALRTDVRGRLSGCGTPEQRCREGALPSLL